jgi:phosphatidylglycerophosphate synthase
VRQAATEGERWAAAALTDLRSGRYRPRAWAVFLRASLERSRATRAERPQLAAQAARWGVGGGAAWIAMCALARRRHAPQPSAAAGLAWWLLVWRMLDWHLGMAESDDGLPRDRLSAADAVTLARFWLVPLLPAWSRSESGLPAVILLGGATDWLDGRLARRCGRTRLGRDLDTTADLAFFGAAAIVVRRSGRLPPLAARAFGLRLGLGLVLALAAVFGGARRPAIEPRQYGAVLRIGGLALCAGGRRTAGTAIAVAGCCVPPRSAAPQLSAARGVASPFTATAQRPGRR